MIEYTAPRITDKLVLPLDVSAITSLSSVDFSGVSLVPGYEYALSIGTVRLSSGSIGYLQRDAFFVLPYCFNAFYDIFARMWCARCCDSYGCYVSSVTFSSVCDAFGYCVEQLQYAESQAQRL